MAGELAKAFPQNNDFLNSLSDIIKNEFYNHGNLSEALKEVNNFLGKETKAGNVNWLGNLNFAVLNIKDSILNFTKVGNIKILLMRDGEILDISQNLELQDQEPYSSKVFSNIASGKLLAHDKIVILTDEVFSAISQNEAILNQLSQVAKEKELKSIFKLGGEAISNISGLCLLISEESVGLTTPKGIPKRIILITGLILILITAYFLFRGEKKEQFNQISQNQEKLGEARLKIMMAENFIILKKEEKAQVLFREAWDLLSQLQASDASSQKEAASLQESIKKYLLF